MMREYLIRTAGTHELPDAARSQEAGALLPAGFACEQVDGTEEFTLLCQGTRVMISPEFPGW